MLLGNKRLWALVDSGADFSMIRDGLQSQAREELGCQMSTPSQAARGASGEPLAITGVLHDVPVVIQGQTFLVPRMAAVVGLVYDMVLGRDFCCRYGTIIDDKAGLLRIRDLTITLPEYKDIRPSRSRILLSSTTVVPARTICLVQARVEGVDGVWGSPPCSSAEGVVEPNQPPEGVEVLVPREVVTVGPDRFIPIRLTNPGLQEVRVLRGTDIGTLHTLGNGSGSHYELCEDSGRCVNVNTTSTSRVSRDDPEPGDRETVIDAKVSDLSEQGKMELQALVNEYDDIFSRGSGDLGRTNLVEHKIDTGDSPPIRQRPRRVPVSLREQVETQKEKMLQDGVIEESDSPWCSPVVLARKKDGSFRFCVDLRAVNAVTRPFAHPLPRVDTALDSLAGAIWYTTLDMASGYWQVGLSADDRQKTAFSTGKGLHQFKVMAMGLRNASGTFQRLMELVLSGLDSRSCLVYLDDIILFSRTETEHLDTLREVFARVRQANLKLKPEKCFIARHEVTFLGHQVSAAGVSPDPRNIEKVLNWPPPATDQEMHSFLGLCGYYARFVPGYAELTKPLRFAAMNKGALHWTDGMRESFQKLRTAMTSPPVLALPSFRGTFVLYTDACNSSVGSVLTERVKDTERVIAYDSKTLTKQEAKWSTYDKELWAVVHAIRRFRQYTVGSQFEVVTDHKPLQNIPASIAVERDGTGRRGRWAVELSSYDFKVIVKPGASHNNADALSRRPQAPAEKEEMELISSDPTAEEGSANAVVRVTQGGEALGGLPTQGVPDGSLPMDTADESLMNVNVVGADAAPPTCEGRRASQAPERGDSCSIGGSPTREQPCKTGLSEAQQQDPGLKHLRQVCESGGKAPLKVLGAWGKFVKGRLNQVRTMNGVIGLKTGRGFRAFVPECMRSEILSMGHEHPSCGHMGQKRTTLRLRQRFTWPGMRRDVQRFCENCVVCQRRHRPSPAPCAPMVTEIPSRPFERIAVDITEMPLSSKGNRYALVIMDYFSKFVRIYPMTDQKVESVVEGLLDWVYDLGVPERIHSDRGGQFESHVFQAMCKELGINKTRTTPYRPQSDGMVERFNRTLKDMVAKYVDGEGLNWDRNVKAYSMAFNSSVHSVTGYSPFFLVHGFEPCLPLDVAYGPVPEVVPIQSYLADRLRATRDAFQRVRKATARAAVRAGGKQDIRPFDGEYKVGDKVWVRDFRIVVGGKPKLGLPYKGPNTVVGKVGQVVYKVQDDQGKVRTMHYNHMKPVKSREPLDDAAPAKDDGAGRREVPGPTRGLRVDGAPGIAGDPTEPPGGRRMDHRLPSALMLGGNVGELRSGTANQSPIYGPMAPYRSISGRLCRPFVPYQHQP